MAGPGLLAGREGTTKMDDVRRPSGARGPTDPADTEGEAPNVSPEEQEAYDQFVGNGLAMMAKAGPALKERMTATDDPVDGLASATAMVVMRLEDSAAKAGQRISPDVLMHGGSAILEILATVASETGVHDFTPEELESATYRALDMYGQSKSQRGEIHQDQAKQELDQIVQADQQGRLGQMVPGLEEHFGGDEQPMKRRGREAGRGME